MRIVDLYEQFSLSREKDPVLLPSASEERQPAAGYLYCYQEEARGDRRPAMLILPGGAYRKNSHSEWEPIAEAYAAHGFRTYVLNYSTKYYRFPTQLNEGIAAILYLRSLADALGLRDKIAVCGFSAGGHLAASLSDLCKNEWIHPRFAGSGVELRPDACVLAYPVISSRDSLRNEESFRYLCGEDEALRRYLSLEDRVHQGTPPTFLWHTEEDDCVPCGNSVLYAEMLAECGVPHKLCLYQKGKHGLNLAKGYEAEKWLGGSVAFLHDMGLFDDALREGESEHI